MEVVTMVMNRTVIFHDPKPVVLELLSQDWFCVKGLGIEFHAISKNAPLPFSL